MLNKEGPPFKSFFTLITNNGFHFWLCPFVRAKIGCVSEGLVTLAVPTWLFSSMSPFMLGKITVTAKITSTRVTTKTLVSSVHF